MSRTLRYILIILLVGAMTLWVLTVYRSCERKKQLEDTTITTDNETGGETDTDADSGELDDLYVDDEDKGDVDSEEYKNADMDSYDGTSDTDENVKSTGSGSGEENESGGVFADGEADIAGEYLVISGAFVLKENAEAHIRDLKKKGFDAERRVFLGSDYHSVIIGNFETESGAQKVANQLGAEAYVHKKRYLKKR